MFCGRDGVVAAVVVLLGKGRVLCVLGFMVRHSLVGYEELKRERSKH